MASSVLVFTSIEQIPCEGRPEGLHYLRPSRRQSVTLLVLLSAAARARVVAADLRLVAAHGLDDVVAADARRLPVAGRCLGLRRSGARRGPDRTGERGRGLFAGAAQDERSLRPRGGAP